MIRGIDNHIALVREAGIPVVGLLFRYYLYLIILSNLICFFGRIKRSEIYKFFVNNYERLPFISVFSNALISAAIVFSQTNIKLIFSYGYKAQILLSVVKSVAIDMIHLHTFLAWNNSMVHIFYSVFSWFNSYPTKSAPCFPELIRAPFVLRQFTEIFIINKGIFPFSQLNGFHVYFPAYIIPLTQEKT